MFPSKSVKLCPVTLHTYHLRRQSTDDDEYLDPHSNLDLRTKNMFA